MGSNRAQVIRILALLLAICGVSACDSMPRALVEAPPAVPMLEGLLASAQPHIELSPRPMPSVVDATDPTSGSPALVIASAGWRVPGVALSDETVTALRSFLDRGGRILLLGYAAALVHRLELEPSVPECAPFRWGFDARTSLGRARLGIEAMRDDADVLTQGMTAVPGREACWFLAGGEPCCVATALYPTTLPVQGTVLAKLITERDGALDAAGAPVLVHWRHGRGAVLALGLEPAWAGIDSVIAQNATRFLQNAYAWLLAGQSAAKVPCWILPDPSIQPTVTPLPKVAQRPIPGAPLLANWGWVASPTSAGTVRDADSVLDPVLIRSWQSGADIFTLSLVDGDRGSLLPWSERDPLQRPKSYRGSPQAASWRPEVLALLAREAHARGMLVHGALDPLPVSDAPVERLAALRFAARELADRRRLGAGALDGFVARDWFGDREALGVAMMQDFHPGGRFVRKGEPALLQSGAVRALDAVDGTPRGLVARGITDGFRNGFPGDLAPLGYLDATARREGSFAGGGSGGDWIAVQAADFVRARRDLGGAMLWQSYEPTTLDHDTQAYVHGVSMEPLVAAVAARCSTIGKDGWRDAQRQLLPEVQRGFGAEIDAPADTVLLQNNHFRICGSGGALELDPSGLGRFRGTQALLLASEFLRTRMTGGRPVADELRQSQIDLLAAGRQPAGGYRRICRVENGTKAPQQLAFGGAAEWPQRVEFPLDAGIGRFDLRIDLRAIAGKGVVAVGVDDGVRAVLPFEHGRLSVQKVLPLQLAAAGKRTLWLEVQDGGAIAIDLVHLARVGDVAAEAEVAVPAGSYAAVRERSASSYHEEQIELTTLADFPGFLLRSDCTRAVRNLQMERKLGTSSYRALRASAATDTPQSLRSPFILAAADPALPDLVVVPLSLGRYDHLELRADGLVWKQLPEAGVGNRIGFCFLPRAEALAALAGLTAVFQQLDRPIRLELGSDGRADLKAEFGAAFPRLVQIERRAKTPFLVREAGWWTWRPAQMLDDGRELLRVWQMPGDVVQLLSGQELLQVTRPGPGSLRNLALRDPTANSAMVCVLAPTPLGTPSLVLGSSFDQVTIDGKPWSFWQDRTVALPNRKGTFSVATRTLGGPPEPRVIACSVGLDECRYDAAARDLLLLPAEDLDRPATLAFTALLSGPKPVRVDGGEIVDEKDLRYASPADAAMAAGNGVLIRFRAGPVRVHYGD